MMANRHLIILLILSACCSDFTRRCAEAYTLPPTDEQRLVRYLTANYSRLGKPGYHHLQPLVVSARLFPIKLQNLMEKDEALQTTVRIQLNWKDPALVYDPSQFGNQTSVILPGGSIWVPDLQISNSLSDLYALLRDPRFDFKVTNDGNVWWHPTGNIATRCEILLAYFPFDYQRCPIVIESVIYTHTQLNLTLRYDKTAWSRSMYAESGHWDLLAIKARSRLKYVTNSTAFTSVEFWLFLGRKSGYYKLNIIFPCGMLSALQMLTFFLPLESSERVPEATTILLSVIVFQSMIIEDLPRSSDAVPLLCVYIDLLTGISVISVGEAVLIAYLVSQKQKRRFCPPWAVPLLKCLYRLRSHEAFIDAVHNSKLPPMPSSSSSNNSGRRSGSCRQRNRFFDDCASEHCSCQQRNCTWCQDDLVFFGRGSAVTTRDLATVESNFGDSGVASTLGNSDSYCAKHHQGGHSTPRSRHDRHNNNNAHLDYSYRSMTNAEAIAFLKSAATSGRANGGVPVDDRRPYVINDSDAGLSDNWHNSDDKQLTIPGARIRHRVGSRSSSHRSVRPVLLAPLARIDHYSDDSESECELNLANSGMSRSATAGGNTEKSDPQQIVATTSFNSCSQLTTSEPQSQQPQQQQQQQQLPQRQGTPLASGKNAGHRSDTDDHAKKVPIIKRPLSVPVISKRANHHNNAGSFAYRTNGGGGSGFNDFVDRSSNAEPPSPFSAYKLNRRRRRSRNRNSHRMNARNVSPQLLIIDWVFLAKVVDYVAFTSCFLSITGVPIALFGVLPPDSPDYNLNPYN